MLRFHAPKVAQTRLTFYNTQRTLSLRIGSQETAPQDWRRRGLRKRMRLSRIGRYSLALVVTVALALGMTACGGGTIAFIWVLGTQYNQIGGFKVDNFTGNLTPIIHSPFSSNGTNPVALVLKPGGRYLYVINKGSAGDKGNISLFSVG